jgi:transcriptional regulator with XRE-family HTH domain
MPRKRFPANAVGPQIRKARSQRGLTQEQLAARCQMAGLDISRATLAQIESQIRYVTDDELFIIAGVLRSPIEDLFPPALRKRRRR